MWKEGDKLTMTYNKGKFLFKVNDRQSHEIFNIPNDSSTFKCYKLFAYLPNNSRVRMTYFFIE